MRKPSPFLNVVVRKFAGAARRFDPRPSESLPSSPSIRGNAAAAPPAFPSAPAQAWPHEDCANEPAGFFACGERNALWALGMKVAGGAENFGVEQEHLNQVFGARLRITALRSERGPGIEFLEYITPPGGRPLPADAKASDLVFWNTLLAVDDISKLSSKLHESGVTFVS